MGNYFLVILALGVLSHLSHCLIYEDPSLDVIVIDDNAIFDPEIFDLDEEVTTTQSTGGCTTNSGFSGNCLKFDECYPYAPYLQGMGFEFSDLNSTHCSGEGIVCCPSYSYGIPSKKPTLPQIPIPTESFPGMETVEKNETVTMSKAKNSCGSFLKNFTDDHVVGGRVANPGEFPWAVAMLNNGQQFCGGSLISNNFVLTAAHCVQGLRKVQGVKLVLGAHDLSQTSTYQSRDAGRIMYHKNFAMRHLNNDVALIQLSSPVQYSKTIQPVCLNSGAVDYSQKVDLAGWGKISNSGRPSRVLRTVKMALISPSSCRGQYQGTGAPPVTSGMICAGEKSPLKDACNGDSGGPLTQASNNRATQVGIVSWGIGCGEKPGVYTNVAEYLSWINKNSNSN